jgi:aminoglycoside/choline kinase family phosphotransferase
MDSFVRSRECRSLRAALGVMAVVDSEPIRIWRLSGVERLRLPDGSTVVFKYATRPFTSEHQILTDLAKHGVPVPRLRAATVRDGVLGMILDDLGGPIRDATPQDAAVAAVRLHAATPPTWLDPLNEPALTALPGQAIACLDQLQAAGRYSDTSDLRDHLTALHRIAPALAAGAERQPFGMCHGELHPSALHITPTGWRLLDFAMALHGPGLLDLAAWSGLRQPADPPTTRHLLQRYVRAGGHPDALADRGGLPAEHWALGWHRIHAAHWLLDCAVTGIDGPDTDTRHLTVLRRQLTSALELLSTSHAQPVTRHGG